jgi:hypothetical protein
MAQVTFVKPQGSDLGGPTSAISKTVQKMPWHGEFIVGVRNGNGNGNGSVKVGPSDPDMASIADITHNGSTGIRWYQLVAKRAGTVTVEARAAAGAVLDHFQLVIASVPPPSSGSVDMEFEKSGESGRVDFKVYNPLEDPNYIENRMEAVGFGIYLFGCLVYCKNMPMPIHVADSFIDFQVTNAEPIDNKIYADLASAQAAIKAAPSTPGVTRYAFYHGASGAVIVPTIFSPATTPRTLQTLLHARQLLAEEVQKELSFFALGLVGGMILKTAMTPRVQAFPERSYRLPPKPPPLKIHPAMQRLQTTAKNTRHKNIRRSAEVLKEPRVFRHTITGEVPPVNYARIEREGAMRLSTGENAHYGEGVYAWHKGQQGVSTYIDIEVSAGTAVETLHVDGQIWYRLVPAQGTTLPVRIVGTNMSPSKIEMGRKLVGP